MPCYDIDGNPVACEINGSWNTTVVTGFGPDYEVALDRYKKAQTSSSATTYSGAGLPPGYVQGSNGLVYKQTDQGLVQATQAELDALNAPKPSTAQPPQPTIKIAPNGDVVRINADGSSSVTGNIPSLAQQPNLSYQQDASGNLYALAPDGTMKLVANNFGVPQLSQADQNAFTAGQNAETRQANAANQAAADAAALARQQQQQGFTANQNAVDRALSAADAAAKYGVSNQQLGMQSQAQNYDQAAQTQKDALGAANQFASLINTTDTSALPAFLAAGGGNIFNAITGANPANALTSNALLPAASTLRQIAEMQRPAPYQFTPVTYNPFQYSGQFGGPPPGAPPPGAPPPSTPQLTIGTPPAMTAVQGQNPDYQPAAVAATALQDAYNRAAGTQGLPKNQGLPAMAGGGVSMGAAIVGDSPSGKPTGHEEIAMPFMMGGRPAVYVMPKPSNMDHMAHFADGGTVVGPTPITVSAQDQPYVDQVRSLRQATPIPGFASIFGDTGPNPGAAAYNTQFGLLPSVAQQSYFNALQTQTGAPASTFAEAAQRYALGGANRTGFGAYHPWQFGM